LANTSIERSINARLPKGRTRQSGIRFEACQLRKFMEVVKCEHPNHNTLLERARLWQHQAHKTIAQWANSQQNNELHLLCQLMYCSVLYFFAPA
jgi:hypothetical protein